MVSRGQMLATCTECEFVVIMSNIYVLNEEFAMFCAQHYILFVHGHAYFCFFLYLAMPGLSCGMQDILLWQVNS